MATKKSSRASPLTSVSTFQTAADKANSAPVFTLQSAPSASRGVAYRYQFAATGNPTFKLSSGSLPPGLNISSAGLLSGTPMTAATYTFKIEAKNAYGSRVSNLQTIAVAATTPVFTAQSAPAGQVGVAYSYTYVATANPTFSVGSGALPAGLTLNSSTGVLSGTPTTVASSVFTVVATNISGSTNSNSQSVNVIAAPVGPIFSAQSAPAAHIGVPYSYTFVASGSPTYSVGSGALPAGITLNGSTGVISGTPTTAATSVFTITATNGGGSTPSTSQSIVTTLIAPVFTAQSPPAGLTGTAYSYQYVAPSAATFAVTSGAVPAGLTLSSAGFLSGTPTAVGSSTFVVTATNAAGSTQSTSQSVTVTTNLSAPVFSAQSAPAGQVGVAYTYTFVASSAASYSVFSGALPAGLTLNTSTGVVSGTPTTAASSTFVIRATNVAGNTNSTSQSVVIAAPSLDTRPKFGTAPANAYTTGTQALLDSMTAFAGSANGGKTGSFTISSGVGQFGWVAVLASASSSGVTFTDSLGAGGWSGAGLPGNNLGASPSISVSTTLFTDGNGTQWRLFRQDFSNTASDTFVAS